VIHHHSSIGVLDLFVAGAGFDIAGAWMLARGLTTSPERAARRLIQSRNSFARFEVRAAEDYADGQIGRGSLIIGFLAQACAYVLEVHGATPMSNAKGAYFGLFGFGAAAMHVVWMSERKLHPRLRNRWLVKFARYDNFGYLHEFPSGRELFDYGQVLKLRAYQSEYGDYAAYGQRVFRTQVRDPTRDAEVRPENFQPYAALDDTHGYVSE
jgi:hypothetical protein